MEILVDLHALTDVASPGGEWGFGKEVFPNSEELFFSLFLLCSQTLSGRRVAVNADFLNRERCGCGTSPRVPWKATPNSSPTCASHEGQVPATCTLTRAWEFL